MDEPKKYNFNGEMLTINDAIKKYNPSLSYSTVYNRINKAKSSPKDALKNANEYIIKNKSKLKRYNFNGKMLSINEAIKEFNSTLSYSTIYNRINNSNIDPYEAITKEMTRKHPKRRNGSFDFNGEKLTIKEASAKFEPHILPSTIMSRICKLGMEPYEAATTPLMPHTFGPKYNFNGEYMSCERASIKFKPHAHPITINKRILNGIDPYTAATMPYKKLPVKRYNFNGKMLSITEAIEEFNSPLKRVTIKYRIEHIGMEPYDAITKPLLRTTKKGNEENV